jgi:hypothetical protein
VQYLVACSLIVLVASGPVWAQTQSPMPAPPMSPAAPATPVASSLEGKVTKVDLPSGTVQVSTGLFGLFGRTLSVTGETQVQVEGRQGTLAHLSEGAEVKASYEMREGKNIATRIELMPQAAAPAKTPAPQK